MKSKKAQEGGSLLLIYFATILIALFATVAMVNRANVESKTVIEVGKRSAGSIGGSILPLTIDAVIENDSLNHIVMVARLQAGNDPVNYDDIIIQLFDVTNSSVLLYDNSSSACSNIPLRKFRIESVVQGNFHVNGKLNKEDLIEICFRPVERIGAFEEFTILIMPIDGSKQVIETSFGATDKPLIRIFP